MVYIMIASPTKNNTFTARPVKMHCYSLPAVCRGGGTKEKKELIRHLQTFQLSLSKPCM